MKKYRLGELIEVSRGASLSGEFFAKEGRYIRLTCGNFDYQNNCFKENISKDNLYYIGEFKEEFLLKEGDIITPLTEQAIGLLGSTALIPESGKYIQSQDVAKVTCNEALLDQNYAFYLLSSTQVKQQLSAGAQQTKIRHTSPGKIKDCIVWLPPLTEQKRIGQLLSTIDRKIALNRAINHNLEAMAKQLYDYWFVQFDFPDDNGNPYKSSGGKLVWNEKLKREVPEGWKVKSIFEELSVQYGFPFSTELFVEEQTDIPVVRIRDILSNSISAYTTEQIGERYRLHEKDLLIGMDGNFHMNYWSGNNSFLNQRSVRLRAVNNSSVSIIQARYDIEPHIKAKELRAKGSTVGHLSDKDLKGLFILVPSIKELRITLDSLLNKIIRNRIEITKLTELRDQLLPLLMNGQVSVNYDLSLLSYRLFLLL